MGTKRLTSIIVSAALGACLLWLAIGWYFDEGPSFKEITIQGNPGPAAVDKKTGKLCWQALTCNNSECSGKKGKHPFLFVHEIPGTEIGPDGKATYAEMDWGDRMDMMDEFTCPACNQRTVIKYLPPETAKREAKLRKELKRSRRVMKINREGASTTEYYRAPVVIQEDLTNLPNLYLMPD